MSEQNAEYGRPVLLDLFCGAGGAAMGYHRAGFDVVGVDIAPQPHYPFKFEQADAMTWPLDGYDAIHASPPCQAHSLLTYAARTREQHPDLLTPTRSRLRDSGLAYGIENVPGAQMRVDLKLCGCMFDLPNLRRERWLETSWHAFDLRPPCQHLEPTMSVAGNSTGKKGEKEKFGRWPTKHDWRRSMGVDWMEITELAQAIPPAYTEYVGYQLLEHLKERAA